MSSGALVELRGVSKHFGGVAALTDVDLTVERGEVHALVGENGAGKSTLGKVVAGVHRADAGEVHVRGARVDFRSPRDAAAARIAFIAQELAIVPDRSVLENVFLGRQGSAWGFARDRHLRRAYDEIAARAGFELDPQTRAGSLRLAQQQQVEIMRALARDADLVIMDEPTAALGGADTARLLDVIRGLRAEGRSIVFVTHFLADALEVADRVTVLKDGRRVRTSPASSETTDSLIESMLGRRLGSMFPAARGEIGERVLLEVEGLHRRGEFAEVSFDVRAGEVVGIAGLVGSGRTELLETLVGLRRAESGVVRVGGEPAALRSPLAAQRRGMVMVPESRKDHGLVLGRSVRDNITLPHLRAVSRWSFVSRARQDAQLSRLLPRVGIDPARLDSPVGELSGGNQQKVIFARWLVEQPTVLLADEPTRGVDVGARAALYELIREVATTGAAVLFVSSDNEEVIGLADRVLVMRAGRLVGQLAGEAISEAAILALMFDDPTPKEAAS